MNKILEARELTKVYDGKTAVAGIDLTVSEGERVALLGPNGAGKTTTLMMLLGVVTPDKGSVRILGHRLPQGREAALAQVGFSAGYMPLAERLRVAEFLELFGQLYGIPHPAGRITEELGRFRIQHLGDQMCTTLSSGQRTLVGIVKAILHRPRLLVLDEPTASLDPDVAQRVRTGLQELSRDENMTMLITSHNMVEIERLCDRVVFLLAGRIVADDSPAAVAARFGRGDLEQVFLHLAGEEFIAEGAKPSPQETDHP